MNHQRQARLAGGNPALAWLADPVVPVPDAARPSVYAAVLATPSVVVMAALASLMVSVTAALRTGQSAFWILVLCEIVVLGVRLRTIFRARRADSAGHVPAIDPAIRWSIAWAALQGVMAFTIALTDDKPLLIVTMAFILGLTAPICARNYAMPRLATLMVMLCDLPFKLGLALSGDPLLWLLLPMTIPFFIGVRALLGSFGRMLSLSLQVAEQHRHLAGHDPLTGLVNRQRLDDILRGMMNAPHGSLALYCIDLDRFKPVNDRYGHAAGDRVLVEVADRLRQAAPDEALVARLGGDEFLVAVTGLTVADAGRLAERLHHALSARSYAMDDTARANVGASLGYACFPEDADTLDQLRQRADAALYAAKRSGRLRRYGPDGGRVSDAA